MIVVVDDDDDDHHHHHLECVSKFMDVSSASVPEKFMLKISLIVFSRTAFHKCFVQKFTTFTHTHTNQHLT
jgi:hypothetical protein